MNGWCKYFTDDTSYEGTDIEVEQRLKSWRNSRQDNIRAVLVSDETVGRALLVGTGNFWQEDDLEVPMIFEGTVKGTRTARRIMKQIHEQDQCLVIATDESPDLTTYSLVSWAIEVLPFNHQVIALESSDIGKWFVVELDLRKKRTIWYIKE